MAMARDRSYVHQSGRLHMEHYPGRGEGLILLWGALKVEHRKHENGESIVRAPSFPALVVGGKNIDEATKNLVDVVTTYIQVFVEKNGIASFGTKLESMGFECVHDAEYDDEEDGLEWLPYSGGLLIPELRVPLAC